MVAARRTARRSTAAPTAPKLDAAQVLARLNEHHRTVVFPAMFDRLSFDHVREVEYHFHVHKPSHSIQLDKTVCFLDAQRTPNATLTIEFVPADGQRLGEWISHVVDPSQVQGRGGILGFTADQETVDRKLAANYESVVNLPVDDRTAVGMGA